MLILYPSCLLSQETSSRSNLIYTGSSTVGNFISDAEKVYPELNFILVTAPESAGGELAISEGRTDLAGIARIPSESILNKGIASKLIGWDAIAVAVHPDNPVTQLTQSQLLDIFTGKVTNWNVFGGPDLKINPYIVGIESATRKIFRSTILGPQDYEGCTEIKPDIKIIDALNSDPGGIGHISYSFIKESSKVKAIDVNGQTLSLSNKNYPITRPLYLLWWPGRDDITAFVDWTMSREGQRLIMNRFIGAGEASVQYSERTGSLIVYTKTYTLEDGGIFYYPHMPYEILSVNGSLLMTVKNHFGINDENPSTIELKPGDYIVRLNYDGQNKKDLYVNIKAGQTSKIFDTPQGISSPSSETDIAGASLGRKEQLRPAGDVFSFFGDFRVRAEQDYRNSSDRFRGRFRIRTGMSARLGDDVRFGLRLVSTPDPNDPNSTHVELDKGFNQIQIAIDRAYLQISPSKMPYLKWWLGKFSNPNVSSGIFSELIWDADIQPEGTAVSISSKLGKSSSLQLNSGTYLLSQFSEAKRKNWLNNTQVAVTSNVSPNWELNIAAGLYYFANIRDLEIGDSFLDANEGNASYSSAETVNGESLIIDRYASDFHILESFMILRYLGLSMPLDIKVQAIKNLGADAQDSGYAFGISYGDLKSKNQWKIYYQYHHLQQDAVFTPFAQDDALARTNANGHVFGIAYNFHKSISLQGWGLVDKTLNSTLPTQSRFRLDLNIKF